MRTVALDLGKRKTTLSEVHDGAVVARRTVRRISELHRDLGTQAPPARVAIEACRDAWAVHDLLTQWGNEVVVVDTTRVRQLGVGRHGKKNDRIDADILALALEEGRIPKAHVLSPRARKVRELLTVREMLVSTRARYVTQCRALLQARLVTVPRCKAADFVPMMRELDLPSECRELVAPLLELLPSIELQIAQVEERLHALVEQTDVVQRLSTVPGVAVVVAAAFLCVIDNPHRFKNARQVSAYLGLVPRERSSGGKRRLGSITKQGNTRLRKLLVQAAWVVLRSRSKDPLVLWSQHVAERRGKRVAVVATARRLAQVLWALWRRGTVYTPARLAERSASGHLRHSRDVARHAAALRKSADKLARQRRASARRAQRARELLEPQPEVST